MPAEAIVVFTFGIIAFYNTIRTGIEKLYDDKETIANFTNQVRDLKAELGVHKGTIDQFQRRWMIWHTDTPSSLFEEFWGNKVQEIEIMLGMIKAKCDAVDGKLVDLLPDASKNRLRRGLQKLRGVSTFVVGLKPRTKALLTELTTQLKSVDSTANEAWKVKRGGGGIPTDERIHRVGNKHLLTALARDTQHASLLLYQQYQLAQQQIDFEIEMNLFVTEPARAVLQEQIVNGSDERNSQIVYSVATSCLNFSFLARENTRPGDQKIRICVQRAREAPDSHGPSLAWACGEAIRNERNSYYFRATDNISFEVRQSARFCEEGVRGSRTYREILSSLTPPDFANPGYLRPKSKTKAAFELVEYGMLLLGTDWLSAPCSCAVLCRDKSDGEVMCSLMPSGAVHQAPRCGNEVAPNCWCSAQVPNEAIAPRVRRIGVLLAEFALGKPVLSAVYGAGEVITHLEFGMGAPFVTYQRSVDEIRQDVELRTESAKYATAVRKCLEYQVDQRRTPEQQSEDYYNEILVPIRGVLELLDDTLNR